MLIDYIFYIYYILIFIYFIYLIQLIYLQVFNLFFKIKTFCQDFLILLYIIYFLYPKTLYEIDIYIIFSPSCLSKLFWKNLHTALYYS